MATEKRTSRWRTITAAAQWDCGYSVRRVQFLRRPNGITRMPVGGVSRLQNLSPEILMATENPMLACCIIMEATQLVFGCLRPQDRLFPASQNGGTARRGAVGT